MAAIVAAVNTLKLFMSISIYYSFVNSAKQAHGGRPFGIFPCTLLCAMPRYRPVAHRDRLFTTLKTIYPCACLATLTEKREGFMSFIVYMINNANITKENNLVALLSSCLPVCLFYCPPIRQPVCSLHVRLFACLSPLLAWLLAIYGCIAKLANGGVLCGLFWGWLVCAKARNRPLAHRKAASNLP